MANKTLIPLSKLAAQFSLRPIQAQTVLTQAGIEPVGEWPAGRGMTRVYDGESAISVLQEYIKKESCKEPVQQLDQDTAELVSEIKELRSEIKAMGKTLGEMEDRNSEIMEAHHKLTTQNSILLRAFGELKMVVNTCVDSIAQNDVKHNSIIEVLEELKSSQDTMVSLLVNLEEQRQQDKKPVVEHTPEPAVAEDATPSPVISVSAKVVQTPKEPVKEALSKIVLVGLTDSQFASIEREFGKLFDIKHFTGDRAASQSCEQQIKTAKTVIVMTKFVKRHVEQVAKMNNVSITRCTGGMSMLSSILTDMYVNS